MNFRTTHNKMTKLLFPYLDPKLIDGVNDRIDNVPLWGQSLSVFQNRTNKVRGIKNNPFDVFNLTKKGHRAKGHDILSAMLLGGIEARKNNLPLNYGMIAAYSHLATDNFSNRLIKSMGIEGRNLFESLYNWTTRNDKNFEYSHKK